jgi:hypothetical protein
MMDVTDYARNLYDGVAQIASNLNPKNVMVTAGATTLGLLAACGGNAAEGQVRHIVDDLRPLVSGPVDSEGNIAEAFGEKYRDISTIDIYRAEYRDRRVVDFLYFHEGRTSGEGPEACAVVYYVKTSDRVSSFFSLGIDELNWEVHAQDSFLDLDCNGSPDEAQFVGEDDYRTVDELSSDEKSKASERYIEGLDLLVDNY